MVDFYVRGNPQLNYLTALLERACAPGTLSGLTCIVTWGLTTDGVINPIVRRTWENRRSRWVPLRCPFASHVEGITLYDLLGIDRPHDLLPLLALITMYASWARDGSPLDGVFALLMVSLGRWTNGICTQQQQEHT